MTSAAVDPVTLEVIRNALPAISNEMSVDLQRTSYNMMIYEVQDYCTALLSQNIGGVSHFVADLGVVIKAGVERYGLGGFDPGDVLIHNHQATAGQHLNNVVIYTPAFFDGELVAFAVVRAHWVDVGGLSTGFGAANAYDPWSEGLQFDNIKLFEKGAPDEKLLRFIRDNIRFPDASMGDLRSQLAACRLGERRLAELLRRYGRHTVTRAIRMIFSESERRCRAVVQEIPDGSYEASAYLDAEGQVGYDIKARVVIHGSDMEIDLSGCSGERESGMNSRTYAAAYIAYKALTAPLEPLNEGSFRALKVTIPEGNMMMARYPMVMARWSVPLPTVIDTICRALSDALPEQIAAAHSGSLGAAVAFSGLDPVSRKPFIAMSLEAGGWGGRVGADGQDASMSMCQGDVRNAPIESLELKAPVLVLERALRADSGGPGQFRGGLGVQTWLRSLCPGRWHVSNPAAGRISCPPWGLKGGKSGQTAGILVRERASEPFRVPQDADFIAETGAEVIYRTAGGGGWGNPLNRDRVRVCEDVTEGYVSAAAARSDYGLTEAQAPSP